MPTYLYEDEKTGFQKDVFHSIAEIDNPSEETIKETTYKGRRMKKMPTAPNFLKFDNLPNHEKTKILKKRSHNHYKKEIHERKMNIDGKTGKQS